MVLAALPSDFSASLLAFAFPFFPGHGDGGKKTAQNDPKTIQMPQKFVFLCSSYLI